MDTEEEEEELSWSCWLRTVFAASGSMVMYVFFGITEAQSAVLLPQLKDKNSYIHVTPDQETWIASLGILSAPVSGLLVGPVIDAIGRKKGIMFFYINMGVGFGIIACATEVWHIYLGRIICAFAIGFEVAALVYTSEICTKKQRSMLLSVLGSIFTGGVSLTYIVGAYLPWNIASGVFSLTSIIYFIIVCFSPESPAWLFRMSKMEASTRSFQWLGRAPSAIVRELELLRLSNKESGDKFKLRTFLEPTVWKPFVILSLYHLLDCASGVYHIMYYTVDFVERLNTTYDPISVGMVSSVARLFASFTIGFYFMAYVGRKFATAFSGSLMTITFVGAGVYEYVFRDVAAADRPSQWIPVTLLIVNVVSGSLGVTQLPWIMIGEVFPLRVRGAMSGAIFVVGTTLMFICIKMYGILVETLQIWGLFFSYAAASFLAIFFGVFLLPETQNRTLYEIERSFLRKNRRQQSVDPPEQEVEMLS